MSFICLFLSDTKNEIQSKIDIAVKIR
uniref:Uncharacterized protein n=1 Tax=Anguilla anguilla TaxID=7936 RepID=A0A0E9TVA0_ANGAN